MEIRGERCEKFRCVRKTSVKEFGFDPSSKDVVGYKPTEDSRGALVEAAYIGSLKW